MAIKSAEYKKAEKELKLVNDLSEDVKKLTDQQLKSKTQEFKDRLEKGETLDDIRVEVFAVIKEEQLMSQYKAQAETKLRDSLILAEIAKLEKINLVDEDYAKEYKRLAKVYGQTEDAIKGMITKEQMQIPMTNDKVIDLLIKANK